LALKLFDEECDHALIKVLTTQVSVTIGRFHRENTIVNREQRDIECTYER